MQKIVRYISDLHLDFKKCVTVSIGLHAAIVFFLTVRLLVFPSDPMIIQNAIRVDVVDLPDKVEAEPAATPAAPTPKEEVKVKPVEPPKPTPAKTVDLKPDKSKQLDAINKLKQMSALDKLKQQKPPPPEPATQFKGNILNAGDSLTGLEKIQFDDYFSKLKSHVRQHWDLPQWLANANLSSQAGVQVDERGFVLKKQILRSSGNEIFDEKVLSTLEKCSPFPEPPARLRDVVRARGIVFNFP